VRSDWTVLLIGGSSATGKSYLARQLALHYQIPLTEVDDIRIAVQQIVEKDKHPDLFYFLEHPHIIQASETSQLVNRLINVAKEIWPALNELISKHIVCNEPVVFEGDGILPELLAQRELYQLKSIFLIDTEEHLYTADVRRRRGEYNGAEAIKQAKFSFQYGLELARQGRDCHFPVIDSSPLETLYTRVLTELER
jgi:2-phosphoglycerate kinase